MPALQIHPERNGFSCSYDAAWQWLRDYGMIVEMPKDGGVVIG
jgi:hypothetical protein